MASIPEAATVYPLLGRPHDSLPRNNPNLPYRVAYPEYLGSSFDASTTNLTYRINLDSSSSSPKSVRLTLSFLSPITPSSTFRQSIPAGYLTVLVEGCLDVNIYTDINGEWVTGNRDNRVRWQLRRPSRRSGKDKKPALKTWEVARHQEQLFTEWADHAEWGTLFFSAPADTHHESGTSAILRQRFAKTGVLRNQIDKRFRKVMDEEPVFAFAKGFKLKATGGGGDLLEGEACPKREDSITFTLALVQDPVVQFASAKGLRHMKPLWKSYVSTVEELIAYHYDDFPTAAALAANYSATLARDAFLSGSHEYKDIAELSARQVLGATQFSGTPKQPLLFLKEISSNGNFQTVDVIFPAFPFFLYTNPRWLAYLLEPLLEHQGSGQYPNDYSMHDLGAHFPNATGHPDGRDEYMPVEECGNMVIMALALANALRYDTAPAFTRATVAVEPEHQLPGSEEWATYIDQNGMDVHQRDKSTTGEEEAAQWLSRSHKLWTQWTGYLVRESLIPHNQLCTDDFAGWLANQTNLALKGIVGIRAMADISDLVGSGEGPRYRAIAEEYIEKWQEYGISRDGTHAKLAYTWYGSWTTLYNLYADSLLCFHVTEDEEQDRRSGRLGQKPIGSPDGGASGKKGPFIPDRVYQIQSDWYHNVLQKYGLPLDSRHLYTKSDWEFFAAAVTGSETRKEILTAVARWVNETVVGMFSRFIAPPTKLPQITDMETPETDRPFTDLYNTEGDGGFPGIYFMARPVVGGHFAFLALERACGGRATEALRFLDEKAPADLDIEKVFRQGWQRVAAATQEAEDGVLPGLFGDDL
jgi:hypothetical protein